MKYLELFHRANEAAVALREAVDDPPAVAVILGSGLGTLAERLADPVVIPYVRIPHFPHPTVPGHQGNLIVGAFGDGADNEARDGAARLWLLQGRFHAYEGHDLDEVTFPVRVLQRLGVTTLILTAATGGINTALTPGDFVALTDHLNLSGANPLRGPNDDRLGPRFPDMTAVYSPALRTLAQEEAERLGLVLKPGVFACMPGPSYETPAEVRMLRVLGADVVGMSTVPEAIVARHAGMDVLAVALVANMAAGIRDVPITHEGVLEIGRAAAPRLGQLIESVVRRLASPKPSERIAPDPSP